MKNRECNDQSKKCLPYPIYCFFTQTTVRILLQLTHLSSSHSQQGHQVQRYVEMVIVGDVLGELLVLLWHLAPLCVMAFLTFLIFLFQPSFLPSFSHLPVHIRKSVTSSKIAFSHLFLVVSIGDFPPEHAFNTL